MLLTVSTVTTQLPPAGTLAPASDTEVAEAEAVTTPPVQVVDAFGDSARVRSAGRLSVSAVAVSAIEFGLLSVIVRVEGVPGGTEPGENALLRANGMRTCRSALAGDWLLVPAPPALAVTALAGIRLV